MKEITKEVEIRSGSMGWDKNGVYIRVYHDYKVIGRIYISKEITIVDSNYFIEDKPDGSKGIYRK